MGSIGLAPAKGDFFKQVEGTFRAASVEGPEFDLRLVECRDILDDDVQETFSLMFLAPADTPAVQRTYRLTNDAMGSLDVFLVPLRQDGTGVYFEAIFNRLKNG